MKIVAALSSPEQDDVIRSILEPTGQWHPPWDRQEPSDDRAAANTPARAPPTDPIVEYDVDPNLLWPDD